jgi:hypothetical protein
VSMSEPSALTGTERHERVNCLESTTCYERANLLESTTWAQASQMTEECHLERTSLRER